MINLSPIKTKVTKGLFVPYITPRKVELTYGVVSFVASLLFETHTTYQ